MIFSFPTGSEIGNIPTDVCFSLIIIKIMDENLSKVVFIFRLHVICTTDEEFDFAEKSFIYRERKMFTYLPVHATPWSFVEV